MNETANMPSGIYRILKWNAGDDPFVDPPVEIIEKKNAYVNAGAAVLLDLLIGAGGTPYSNANAYIGAGDGTTAVAATQTDLQAPTNKLRKGMDTGYPARNGQSVTWRATFGATEANFTWNEVALFNAGSAGQMLSRIVQNMGTKANGVPWAIEYLITVPG